MTGNSGREAAQGEIRRAPGPSPYITVWIGVAGTAALLGLMVLAMEAALAQVLVMAATYFTLGACAGFLYMVITDRFEIRILGCWAGRTGLALMGASGLWLLSPVLGGLGVLAIAVLSPWTMSGFRLLTSQRRKSSVDSPAPRQSDRPLEAVGTAGAPIDDLADFERLAGEELTFELRIGEGGDLTLFEAWATSSAVLARTHTLAGRLLVTRSRQFLLDEMERRDPVAFAAWLASRPGSSDDPSLYFTHRRH